jgi:hypothetical protein
LRRSCLNFALVLGRSMAAAHLPRPGDKSKKGLKRENKKEKGKRGRTTICSSRERWSVPLCHVRVAHFFALHAQQALPLVGLVLVAARGPRTRLVVAVAALAYLASGRRRQPRSNRLRACPRRPQRRGWARLLKRVFDIDIERCPRCGGHLKIIEAPALIERILTPLGLCAQPPPRTPARRVDRFRRLDTQKAHGSWPERSAITLVIAEHLSCIALASRKDQTAPTCHERCIGPGSHDDDGTAFGCICFLRRDR